MTSTRALPVPHLELPTSEDIMEFSSELDRRPGIDEDIDIDFDFANEQLQDQDNDYIIEDARSEAGTGAQDLSAETGNDDVMLDEEGSPAEMHDDTLVQDEDVDDAGDFTQNDSNRRSAPLHKDADQYNDEVLDHSQQMDLPSDRLYSAPADDLEENIPEVSDNQILEAWQEETLGTLDVDPNAKALEQPFPDLDPAVPVDSLLEHLRHEPDRSKTLASARNSATGSVASNTEPKLESHPEAALNNRGSPYVDFIAHTPELADAVKSVHPVVVIYQGSEISLFPPSAQNDSATFFLHDESLASNSISDLLVACKGVLADSISEEDELELRIEELGLCISEVSSSPDFN